MTTINKRPNAALAGSGDRSTSAQHFEGSQNDRAGANNTGPISMNALGGEKLRGCARAAAAEAAFRIKQEFGPPYTEEKKKRIRKHGRLFLQIVAGFVMVLLVRKACRRIKRFVDRFYPEPWLPSENNTGGRVFKVEVENLEGGRNGNFVVETFPGWAPLGAARFHRLMDEGFYRDAAFFRVVRREERGFVVQFGLPAIPVLDDDKKEKPIGDDPVIESNAYGTLAFANSGRPNTRTIQVFINTNRASNGPLLDRQGFAPFAKVVKGMDVVNHIYAEYGEEPNQWRIQNEGNKYLKKYFPLLTYISNVEFIDGYVAGQQQQQSEEPPGGAAGQQQPEGDTGGQ